MTPETMSAIALLIAIISMIASAIAIVCAEGVRRLFLRLDAAIAGALDGKE